MNKRHIIIIMLMLLCSLILVQPVVSQDGYYTTYYYELVVDDVYNTRSIFDRLLAGPVGFAPGIGVCLVYPTPWDLKVLL